MAARWGALPMSDSTRKPDTPLSVTAYLLTCATNSFNASNSLTVTALEAGLDRDVWEPLVDAAVAFGQAREVSYRMNTIALGYRALAIRAPRLQ